MSHSLSHKQTTYIIDLFKDYLHHDFHIEWHSPDRIDKERRDQTDSIFSGIERN